MNVLKKALVIGGSNGIGLAISTNLIKRGYFVKILDIYEPDKSAGLEEGMCSYTYFNMLDFDESIIEGLSKDDSLELCMITAGIGRIANFDDLHLTEIEKIFEINTVSTVKIIKKFYDRLKTETSFYLGVMGSIAGLVSSPMFSVYAASKAAICRFTESVNIELEMSGFQNRILTVNPGSIKGTRFNGGRNELSLISDLASEIVEKLISKDTVFIPNYESTYKGVIDRYNSNPHEFGVESYRYKEASGRIKSGKNIKVGYLSGTFDLFHIGHLNLIRKAKQQCDYLIVGVHRDTSHKGGKETFIPFEERLEIVRCCKYVDKVVESCKEDSDAWDLWHYDRLFVGSDYKGSERFTKYEKFFTDKAVEIIYMPYTKTTSSTQIRNTITNKQI